MDAWERGDVPDKVVNVMYFIYSQRINGKAPTWREIAEVGGWSDRPRTLWRPKMRYLKRWGVVWWPNKPKSTKIAAEIVPLLLRMVDDQRDCRKIAR